MNFETLTETIDPQNVLVKLFSHKLISLEEMKEIEQIQIQSGKKQACEEMMYLLLKEWRNESYNIFLEVLNRCNYEECTVQLQSNPLLYPALCLLLSSPQFLPSILIKCSHNYNSLFMMHVSDFAQNHMKQKVKEWVQHLQMRELKASIKVTAPMQYGSRVLRFINEVGSVAMTYKDLAAA